MEEQRTSTQVVIPVADVVPAVASLAEMSYQDALERLLAAEQPTKSTSHWPIEACSRHESSLVAGIDFHPLVAALHLAYAGHRPVALSPDMIWLMICQGVAHHINANAEQLRPRFVRHPGRLTLEARDRESGRSPKGTPDDPWRDSLASFSSQIANLIGPTHGLFVPAFSTTGPTERTAAEIVLFDSTHGYFHHLLTTMVCGIPAVTLEGTRTDWQAIVERVERFGDLGLEWWLGPLRPILRQFASAAAGHPDRGFWRSIYRIDHPAEPCSLDSAAGWIGAFFPYLLDRRGRPVEQNPWLPGEADLRRLFRDAEDDPSARKDDLFGRGFLHEGHLPSGLVRVPLSQKERDQRGQLLKERSMELFGGFVGVRQDAETFALRPEIGWAAREAAGIVHHE